MKKLLTLALALVALAIFSGLGVAQQEGVEKSPPTPTGVEKKQPATGEKAVDKASPKLITGKLTGKVTGVDPTAKTFTVMIQGRWIIVSGERLSKLPTVGNMIDIAYTWNPDKPPMATSTTESGSKVGTGEEKGHSRAKNTHCSDYGGHKGDPLVSLNLKGGCPWW